MKQANLPLNLEVLDAEILHAHLDRDENLYIKYVNGKYSLQARHFTLDVEWKYHYQVTLEQAREIVTRKYALWHWHVPDNLK